MRPAGAFVADVLTRTKAMSEVGTNLLEIDAFAHDLIRAAGAESCYLDYHPSFGAMPFGKVMCTSVNDAALHGLPHDYALRDGDLLTLDFAASVNGWVADAAVSFVVGTPRPQDARLIAVCEEALAAGIAAVRPDARMGDVSAAIGAVAHRNRLKVNMDFGGHGVGHEMHGDPHVPNDGRPGRGYPLAPGLVFAIEPWFMLTTDRIRFDKDGWTIRSKDGSRAAHIEHTVVVTEDGCEILTRGANAVGL